MRRETDIRRHSNCLVRGRSQIPRRVIPGCSAEAEAVGVNRHESAGKGRLYWSAIRGSVAWSFGAVRCEDVVLGRKIHKGGT